MSPALAGGLSTTVPPGKPHIILNGAQNSLFFFLHFLKIYLFLALLGLYCCARAFSSSGERGLLFVAVRRLLIVVASLVAEHGP